MSLSAETVQTCLRRAREVLRKYGQIEQTPVDIVSLARTLGFQVVQVKSVGDEFSGLVSPKHKLLGVNGNHHPHRQRFTVAHELAHILLNHPPEQRCTAKEVRHYNREADMFASELLIPTHLLTGLLHDSFSTKTLSRLFDVSEEAITLKIKQIGEFGRE